MHKYPSIIMILKPGGYVLTSY